MKLFIRSKMRAFGIPLCFLFVGLSGVLLRAEEYPEGPEAGRALAAELRSMRPVENMKWRGTLNIFGRGRKASSVPVTCQTTLMETNWSVTYTTEATPNNGAEKLTVVFFTNAPNQYVYARAASPGEPLGEARTLTGAEADIPLAGSDFWLSDLGFEFYHWPEQIRHKGEMRRSRPCYVLESVNPHPAPGGYAKVLTWVDKDSGQPLQAEARGADHGVVKVFEVGSIQKVRDHYEVKNLKMSNGKNRSWTELDFDLDEGK